MNRNSQGLRTVDVRKARRVGNDGICDKRLLRLWIIFNAGPPAAIKHLRDHALLPFDLAIAQRLHLWNQPRVLDHIGHQKCWITADGKELEE